ncbi:hypothetical protein [Dickeya oryzae]
MLGNINSIQRQPSLTDIQNSAPQRSHTLTQGSTSVPAQFTSASLQRAGMHAGIAHVSQQPSLPNGEGAQIGRSPNLQGMKGAIDRALSTTVNTPAVAGSGSVISLDKKRAA